MSDEVLERAMDQIPVTRQSTAFIERAPKEVRERAAKSAVNDIPMHVKDIGVSPHQAEEIQEAFRLGLLGNIAGASERLTAAGLPQDIVSLVVKEMQSQ